jgi:Zn-dependent M28 family amino/carboxypeptidase
VAGEAAAQWVADEMKRIGLAPAGDGGTYFQTVQMVAQLVDPAKSSFGVAVGGKTIPFEFGKDVVYGTKHQKDTDTTVAFKDSDMVFVGYGVNAPERKWNDFAGVDVKGKTIVMFVNDPGFVTNDTKLFNGKAMTYYGRWTYKFEEAARQGAAAAILIHETGPAAYGWNVVHDSWTGTQSDLVRDNGGADRSLLEGWITLDKATELFKASGLDIDKLRAAANKPGFKAVPIPGAKLSASISQSIKRTPSRNVLGTLKGTTHPEENLIYTAHWDHLGKKEGGVPGEDLISNGAVDNATGVAGILEIAEKMKSDPPMARSVTFIAVTLEESGLLGSAYYADHPTIPLNKIVAGINIDAIQPIGKTKDVIVVGYGASELDDMLAGALKSQGRVVRADPEPEKGYFYRSDHISLAKKGVPMLYADGGIDKVDGGVKAGEAAGADYREHRYHGVKDEYDPNWDLAGVVDDLNALYTVGSQIASGDKWPTWRKGNEFEAARKASLAGK